jgi:NitT/TauT family transport system ATP-binding protein
MTAPAPSRDPARGPAAVRVSRLCRAFAPGVPVLSDIDLSVTAGEFVAILGPSGCGKSTLLRLIAGLDRPDQGTVESRDGGAKGGVEAPEQAFVFQDPTLLPWRNVAANTALPLELRGVRGDASRTAARQALARVGLEGSEALYPNQLSGGMRMRASLARALVTRPSLLLLDEPFSALDEPSRFELQEDLHALWLEGGMTVVFVTHSVAEATFLAQRVVVLGQKPSRIVLDSAVGLPRERAAATRTSPGYLEAMRLVQAALPTRVRTHSAGGPA